VEETATTEDMSAGSTHVDHSDACSSGSEDALGDGAVSKSKSWNNFDLMISCMRLSILLRNADQLHQAIAASLAAFKAGTTNTEVAAIAAIDVGAMRVPSRSSTDRGWIRLDCMATLYERAQNAAGIPCFRSLMADSSPKLWNYFCVREKRTEIPAVRNLQMPLDQPCSSIVCADAAADGSWDSMKLPTCSFAWQLSVLGHGAANIIFKFRNLLHGMLLRTSNNEELTAYRLSVVGWTSDQGTEYKLADICFAHEPNRETFQAAAKKLFNHESFLQSGPGPQIHWLFPWALSMVGHLHMVSNGLESAVTKTRIWKGHFKNGLSALLSFLNSKSLRQRFQATCLPTAEWSIFDSFGKQLLDWRWESLGDLLEQLLPLVPILQKRYDLQKLRSGHHTALSEIDASILSVCGKFLHFDWLEAFLEMLRVLSIRTNHFIGWLEGCSCHSHIWLLPGKTWRQKQAIFAAETGLNSCPCKGCRGNEMAAYAATQWLCKVCDGSSAHLTKLLSRCDDSKRTGILSIQQELRESVKEEFQAKLLHWHHLPYLLLGMLYPDLRRAKEIARRCLSEFQQSDRSKLHRVCHRFLSDDAVLGQIRSFAFNDAPIQDYAVLHNLLTMYNSVPLVERSIEGEHAKIEKAGANLIGFISLYKALCLIQHHKAL
jgi:hypothetical protein